MKTYVFQYTYGEFLDKSCIQGITCPICGQNKLISSGRVANLGWRFKCLICAKDFYVKVTAIDSQAVSNISSRVEI